MRREFVALALGIGIALSLAELVAVGWYWNETGNVFYRDPAETPTSTVELAEVSPDDARFDPIRPRQSAVRAHPFFGFVKFPDPLKEINLRGFMTTPKGYPVEKLADDQYFIGIFGGSVASALALASGPRLIERIREVPGLRDRDLKLLNFASGGYKEPQQLLVLTYYLAIGQVLDMVINIDGFNEVALSRINRNHGIDLAMPSADHILPLSNLLDGDTLTPERIAALARIHRDRENVSRLTEWTTWPPLAIVWLVRDRVLRFLEARLAREVVAFQDLASGSSEQSLFYLAPMTRKLDDALSYEISAELWSRSSLLMDVVLRNRGVPYFHFLQPNQYYSKRSFDPAEASVALSKNHRYGIGGTQGYPVLEAHAKLLMDGGVHYFSGVELFDREARPVYKDDCCHFNQLGNDMLADFVGQLIAGVMSRPPEIQDAVSAISGGSVATCAIQPGTVSDVCSGGTNFGGGSPPATLGGVNGSAVAIAIGE